MLQGSLKDVAFVHVHEFNAGLQIILKLQGPCGLLTYQVLLGHINILGPTFSMKYIYMKVL